MAEDVKRRTKLLGVVAAVTAVFGLTLLVFQNISAVCQATGLLCRQPQAATTRAAPAGWKRLAQVAPYSTNWERDEVRPSEVFPQIVTRFDIPMTTTNRLGTEVSPGEYVEAFSLPPLLDQLTVQIRIDRQTYWLMSRQTFRRSSPSPELEPGSAAFSKRALYEFENEISETRFLLKSFEK